jgi:multicomponent Na+:H+ antiporter subunit E
MTYLPGLVLALAGLWFALSGETEPLFLILGAVSVLAVLWLAARLGIIGRDASPYHRIVQLLVYLAGLVFKIAASNLAVVARILGPRSAIDPVMVKVDTRAKTDLGKALFANSITLTPGTVTADVEGDKLLVHALVREASPPSSFAGMDKAAARAADGKA